MVWNRQSRNSLLVRAELYDEPLDEYRLSEDSKMRLVSTGNLIDRYESVRDVLGSAELDPETGIFSPSRRIAVDPDLYVSFDLLRQRVMVGRERAGKNPAWGTPYVVLDGRVRIGYPTNDLRPGEPDLVFSADMISDGLERIAQTHRG